MDYTRHQKSSLQKQLNYLASVSLVRFNIFVHFWAKGKKRSLVNPQITLQPSNVIPDEQSIRNRDDRKSENKGTGLGGLQSVPISRTANLMDPQNSSKCSSQRGEGDAWERRPERGLSHIHQKAPITQKQQFSRYFANFMIYKQLSQSLPRCNQRMQWCTRSAIVWHLPEMLNQLVNLAPISVDIRMSTVKLGD